MYCIGALAVVSRMLPLVAKKQMKNSTAMQATKRPSYPITYSHKRRIQVLLRSHSRIPSRTPSTVTLWIHKEIPLVNKIREVNIPKFNFSSDKYISGIIRYTLIIYLQPLNAHAYISQFIHVYFKILIILW